MKHPQIRFWIFFPSNQNPTKTIQPTMRSFDNPTPLFFSRVSFDFFGFFTPRADMQREAKFFRERFDFVANVTGIQTQVLFPFFGWPRPTNDYTFERFAG